MSNQPGQLFVVATPIGNLGDITQRAIETLKSVDVVFAEDTRHSLPLLNALGINVPCRALHEHNEAARIEMVMGLLRQGQNAALISDAGTPLISDPGFVLVRALREADMRVTPIPGVCAIIAALSAAGLPTDRFCFEGFLPAKRAGRTQVLQQLAQEQRTLVFYESPHRILESLQDMAQVWGDQRRIVMARELTKRFETFLSGSVAEVLARVEADPMQQKGEMVILVQAAEAVTDDEQLALELDRVLLPLVGELPLKQAVKLAVQITGMKKNPVYQRALTLTHDAGKDSD